MERHFEFKMQYSKDGNYPQIVHMFNVISIKIQARLFLAIDKPIPKFISKDAGPRIAKTILTKKNKV